MAGGSGLRIAPFRSITVRPRLTTHFAADIRPGTIPGSTSPQSFDETAGATFSTDWLFVNIQTPGITFAITGPGRNGQLG